MSVLFVIGVMALLLLVGGVWAIRARASRRNDVEDALLSMEELEKRYPRCCTSYVRIPPGGSFDSETGTLSTDTTTAEAAAPSDRDNDGRIP